MAWLTEDFCNSWEEGTFVSSYDTLGSHLVDDGAWFAVWAPHAEYVAVKGDFNGWDAGAAPMERHGPGLWSCFIPGVEAGQRYKYHIARGPYRVDKTDPYAFALEPPASNGSDTEGLSSIVTDLSYEWNDDDWMKSRLGPKGMMEPISVYEVHLGSWQKNSDGYSLSYREIAKPLADYVTDMGFTHIELMPIMEHPFYGSWGYQIVGYYAPTHRFGSPQDLMYFVDYMHQRGIGVLLDWVPAHFATDPQGLVFFDGSTLYEYDDPQMRYHPDWGTYVFDYNKPGVKNFLVSNAHFWLDHYHFDGLRFDAVASMLYRDYSRDDWSPNMFGGRENLEAIDVLKRVNETVYERFGEVMMIAEESTAWPGVSKPTYDNGLGFLYKWNMGWMHDTLEYISKDPVHRKYHHNDLTFPLVYAFSEHYMLPLSHDEVVHGKGSLWDRMPGDIWQKAANMRLLYGHMFGHPGKKLLFMGDEFGQTEEWNHNDSIHWDQLNFDLHKGIQTWVAHLNQIYRNQLALWKDDHDTFHWIDYHDAEQSVVSYWRQNGDEIIVFAANYTPVPREGYRVGLPRAGTWRLLLNSDDAQYGGSGVGLFDTLEADEISSHGQPASTELLIPPLGMLIMIHAG